MEFQRTELYRNFLYNTFRITWSWHGAEKSKFKDQFVGIRPMRLRIQNGASAENEIDAISSATITKGCYKWR